MDRPTPANGKLDGCLQSPGIRKFAKEKMKSVNSGDRPLSVFFVMVALVASRALGDSPVTNEWGAISNGVQMSISFDGKKREIKTNEEFQLLVSIKNLGTTNAWSYLGGMANSELGNGLHCVVISPSGKDVSPSVKFRGEAFGFINCPPGGGESFKFNLSRICRLDEMGTYKIIAQKSIYFDVKKSWVVTSNPLFVKVVP